MSYFTDMNDIPTEDLINTLSSIILKRNDLIFKGRCPYCGWDKGEARPHGCKYSNDVDQFQKGIIEIIAKGYISKLPWVNIPLVTPLKMAEEKAFKDGRHEFVMPMPGSPQHLCGLCFNPREHIFHREPKYAAPYTRGPRQAYVLPESAQQQLKTEYVPSNTPLSEFDKIELLKFMQEHQDELRTALGMGKVNKTRERIAELTAEVEHEKNKAAISIKSLQDALKEANETIKAKNMQMESMGVSLRLATKRADVLQKQKDEHLHIFGQIAEMFGSKHDGVAPDSVGRRVKNLFDACHQVIGWFNYSRDDLEIGKKTMTVFVQAMIGNAPWQPQRGEVIIPNTPGITEIKPLTFLALREANRKRLPLFKDKHGNICHKIPNVTDWTIDQWYTATSGELGEFANLVKKLNRGDLTYREFKLLAAKELADVNTYLDMLADRCEINLANAIVEKFNEVSERVGATTRL